MIDEDKIKEELVKFIKKYKSNFDSFGKRQSQLFELAALVLTAEHYRLKNYEIQPKQLFNKKFKVKTSARGYPKNFSYPEGQNGNTVIEMHANLPVQSYYEKDEGIYVVYVGIIEKDSITKINKTRTIYFTPNKNLIIFLEVKKIVIYPMLLAQFIGIVHEIKPVFLNHRRPYGFKSNMHFDPALISIGYLHPTCKNIALSYSKRKFHIKIVPNFDIEISKLKGGSVENSPLG